MSPRFEMPSHADLIAEQAEVQDGKHRTRMLDEYNGMFFPGEDWRPPSYSPVSDFLRPFVAGDRVSLESLVAGLVDLKGRAVNWVEMGGGAALAMRELRLKQGMATKVRATNVDLFELALNDLPPENIHYLESNFPGITADSCRPEFIQDNIETVQLPQAADLITSVETMQYLNDPLGSICNWYNQLAGSGFLIISTERDWPSWIRYEDKPADINDIPAAQLLRELVTAGINFAVTDREDHASGFRPAVRADSFKTIVVQKNPDTALICKTRVVGIWNNPSKFKAVYYEKPADQRVIEVVSTSPKSA